MQTNFFEADHPFGSPFQHTLQLQPLSPLRACFDSLQDNLVQVLQLANPQICYGPGIIEVQPDPHEQPVKPQVIGKSPPFGPWDCSNRSEIPSTIMMSENDEQSIPQLSLEEDSLSLKIRSMIQLLADNSQMPPEWLQREGQKQLGGDSLLQQALKLLIIKFKGAKKSREELVKFIIRKALAFEEERVRRDKKCFNNFGKNTSRVQEKINKAYLFRLFQDETFRASYNQFLEHFERLAYEDNQHKMDYLVRQVEYAVSCGEVAPVGKVSRLPWTEEMLKKAKIVAVQMGEGRFEGRRRLRE